MIHGWSGSTVDADLVPAADTRNLDALARALLDLKAVVYADPARTDLFADGKPPETDDFGYSAEALRRARTWHLTSSAGLIDVAFAIDGVGTHSRLARKARPMEIFGVHVKVASLDDIIASKRYVARPKDLRVLPELEQLRNDLSR